MNTPTNNEQSATQTARFLYRLATGLVALGGMALLVLAVSAARAGVFPAAWFIGVCGIALLASVAWAWWKSRTTTSPTPDSRARACPE